MGKCLFITGTGTDIGKTYVTGLIVKKLVTSGLSASYYKAALSGAEPDENGRLVPGDAEFVKEMAELEENASDLVSYIYREAVSPHLAAKINQRPIDFAKVAADFENAKKKCDYLTVEGSGGIICPLRWDETEHVVLDDLVKRLGLGTLIVADAGMGTINSAVLTVEHLRARDIPIKGIMLNNYHAGDIMEEDNRHMIEAMTGIEVVACIAKGDTELNMPVEKLTALYK